MKRTKDGQRKGKTEEKTRLKNRREKQGEREERKVERNDERESRNMQVIIKVRKEDVKADLGNFQQKNESN